MGGGKMIVCGWDCAEFPSVLGERACTGMVGGTLYFRGDPGTFSEDDVEIRELDDSDREFLKNGLGSFLSSLGREELYGSLDTWQEWRKLVPHPAGEPRATRRDVKAFHASSWIRGGIFSDVVSDSLDVVPLVSSGEYRLRVPSWDNAAFAAPCEYSCPSGIPTHKRFSLLRQGREREALEMVLDYSPFPGSVCGAVCPNPCMEACTRGRHIDFPMQIGALGRLSAGIRIPAPKRRSGKKAAVIGSGVGGLSAAWQLARMGHEVTVYEADSVIGGKIEQVIPRERLDHAVLEAEIGRIAEMGVHFVTSCRVDRKKFDALRAENDAVVVAVGGTRARIFDWPGKERIVPGIEFLKAVNRGDHPKVGRNVIVIGCGNAGMDAAAGAYAEGAGHVVCIDVQKPAAFAREIAHIESLGGELIWPVMTSRITEEGIIASDGRLIPGDMVIITIGDEPEIEFLPEGVKTFRGNWLIPEEDRSVLPGVFAAGDVIRPGLLTAAIGSGREAAMAADAWMRGVPYEAPKKRPAAEASLHLEYFSRIQKDEAQEAPGDWTRCVSCGSCRDCGMCMNSCPKQAISRIETDDDTGYTYVSDPERCIGCGICAGVCPCGVWTIRENIPLN